MIKMNNQKEIEKIFIKHRFKDFKWINPQKIIVSHWVRLKCMYGCKEYGKNACCPPNTPSVDECQKFFMEYNECVIFHFKKKFPKPEKRYEWTQAINERLLKLEQEVFFTGNQKTFLMFIDSCNICTNCSKERITCNYKISARPTPEAMAVDVFSTVRQLNYPIKVLHDYSETMNRYAFLLIK